MKNLFTSLNGAVTLSAIAMLPLLARGMGLDAAFVLPNEVGVREDQPVMIALLVLWVTVLFGGWIWALLAAVRGGRGGVIWAFIFSLFTALISALTLLVFCAGKGCAAWPVGNIIVWAGLIAGLAASVALGLQLRAGGWQG
jgi:hypothetical protein